MFLTLPLLLRAKDPILVQIFLATQCPISNRYIPELNRIARLYQPQGVQFIGLFAEAGLSALRLEEWVREFSPVFPAALDTGAVQARKASVTLTPEVAVSKASRLCYRGRIDDRYVSWGKSRPQPTRHDLAELLSNLVAGKSVTLRFTKAWGCYIESL